MKYAVTVILALMFMGICAVSVADVAPTPVIDLKATPVEGRVKLEWCKPKGIEGILYYEIYRKTQDKALTDADIVQANRVGIFGSDGGCVEYIDTAVQSGSSYSYAVIVVSVAGARSTISQGKEGANTVVAMP
jgi:hypothetical protein